MTRDYKPRQKASRKKPAPAWLWMLVGLLLGGFLVGLAWLKMGAPDSGGGWVSAAPDRPPKGKAGTTEKKEKIVEEPARPKPRFDFYTLLPEMEVVVPDDELEPNVVIPAARPGAASVYRIQVGSFRRSADADRLKAQLALLGIEASVIEARISARDTRYRVRSGPYKGKPALAAARTQLAENGFKGIIIRSAGKP